MLGLNKQGFVHINTSATNRNQNSKKTDDSSHFSKAGSAKSKSQGKLTHAENS